MPRSPAKNFEEDPRVNVARRGLVLSWTFFTVYLATTLVVAAAFASKPLLFGLPRWVALSCIVVPGTFVVALIPLVERCIPNISLSDDEGGAP